MKAESNPYLATAKKIRALASVVSPGEIEILKASGEKRVNAEMIRLKARAAESAHLSREVKQTKTELENVKYALKTLARHERAKLSNHMVTNYCRVQTPQNGAPYVPWPTRDYLAAIRERVANHLKFTGVRIKPTRPMWKGFKLLDKRLRSLQLADQVNELAERAHDTLKKDKTQIRRARPLIFWLWVIGHPSASKLMKFDRVAQLAVKKVKQEMTNRETKAKKAAARERKCRQRARCRIRVTA